MVDVDTGGPTDGTDSDTTGGRGRIYPLLQSLDQNAERYLIYVLYTYLVFIILAEVVRRFVLDFSSLWGTRTAIFAYIYLTYLGMSWAIYKRAHIRLDAIFDLVSERTEGYLYLFGNAMMLLFALLTLNYSIPLVFTSLEFGATTQALRVNRAFFQAAIPLGFALLSVRVLQRSYYDVKDIRNGRPVYKGDAIFLEEEDDQMEGQTTTESEKRATTEGDR